MRRRRQWSDLIVLLALIAVSAASYRWLTRPDTSQSDAERCSQTMAQGVRDYRAGRMALAIGQFSQVLQINPGHLTAYRCRGMARAALGQFDRARADFDQGIERGQDPINQYVFPQRLALLYQERARLEVRMGQYEDALSDCQQMLTNGVGLGGGGMADVIQTFDIQACATAGQGKWEEAEYLLGGLARFPERAAEEGLAGQAFVSLAGIQLDPLAYRHLAGLEHKLGHLAQARKDYARGQAVSHAGPCPICDYLQSVEWQLKPHTVCH